MSIQLKNVSATYDRDPVVDKISVRIPKGKLIALVGPNGCGKSTLLRVIARLHNPSDGTVIINDLDIWKTPLRRVAKEVSLLPQYPIAPPGITVEELTGYGRHPHQGLFSQWSEIDQQAIHSALSATEMEGLANHPLERLSGGQRQRAWLSMALAREAPVMLLDEPTSALDLGHQVEVLSLVRSLADQGRTILMVVHDLFLATRYANYMIAMKKGRIIAKGNPTEIVDAYLVKTLYQVDVDVLQAPGDNCPLVVPKRTIQ